MIDHPLQIDRRSLLGGLGATCVFSVPPLSAQTRTALSLEAVTGTLVLKPGQPPTPIWQLTGGAGTGALRFKRGETVDVTLTNRLPVPVRLNWVGLDGEPAAEPLTGRPAVAPDASVSYPVTFRHAGTLFAELWLPEDPPTQLATTRAVIVSEMEAVTVDRDEVLLIADARESAAPDNGAAMFTVNGQPTWDVKASHNQRLRLRIINSSQANMIAVKISDCDVQILAIDGRPSEPFLARDGLLVLAPATRIDVFIDVTRPAGSTSAITLLDGREARPIGRIVTSDGPAGRDAPLPLASPLPSNGLPTQIDLKSALRADLALNVPGGAGWLSSSAMLATTPPTFKIKRGRPGVLTLTNRGDKPVIFRLHGHHFRLLDRLDDGWKPFWLDTLAINAGQTQRIAFLAEYPGLYPIEARVADRAFPRLFRSYLVE